MTERTCGNCGHGRQKGRGDPWGDGPVWTCVCRLPPVPMWVTIEDYSNLYRDTDATDCLTWMSKKEDSNG